MRSSGRRSRRRSRRWQPAAPVGGQLDLKPSNILVTAEGVPKLLDFGIAKLLDPSATGERTLTSQRAFTPDYAAPEQVAGDQPLTTATDVYSLAGRRATALTGGAVPDLFVLACNHALLNDRPTTGALLQRLRGMARKRYVDPFHFVAIHAYLGEPERAFEHLETSFARRSYWMTTLKVHPVVDSVVDSLRGDPRFAEMLRRMKLE